MLLKPVLLKHADATAMPDDVTVSGICADTRKLKEGDLFVCMPSTRTDTHAFMEQVMADRAGGLVVHGDEAFQLAREKGWPVALVRAGAHRFNFALGRICRDLLEDPSADMVTVGVTGTNGKSTTAWILRDVVSHLGERTGYLGTLGLCLNGETFPLSNTTPFPVELWNALSQARQSECRYFFMEASSHALFERRLAGVSFGAGVFTNLSQDHLDYHGDMRSYADAKKLLFTEYAAGSAGPMRAAINMADDAGGSWLHQLPMKAVTFGTSDATIHVEAEDVQFDSISLRVHASGGQTVQGRAPIGGTFNVQNLAAAIACLYSLGFALEDVCEAIRHVTPVPGRFEPVANDLGIGVVVDYAHTPDALEKLLEAARRLDPKRLITVFGCGGDRDRTKRPLMAKAVATGSDLVVLTSDNPRTEDPEQILDDAEPGLTGVSYERVTDRREAVATAITMAEPGDLVVIAGKGHETYQEVGGKRYEMDDRQLAAEALEKRR